MLALGQGLGVAHHAGQVLLSDAGEGQEAVVDGELDFTDDMKAVAQEEVIVPVDASTKRVLHGKHSPIRDPELDGLESDFELIAGDGLAARVGLSSGRFAIRAGDSLVGHA